jgi:hypothetical protein
VSLAVMFVTRVAGREWVDELLTHEGVAKPVIGRTGRKL